MDLDELLAEAKPHEHTPTRVNQKVTRAGWVALGSNIAGVCVYTYYAAAIPQTARWLKPAATAITWAGNPTPAIAATLALTALGVVLALWTRGYTKANLRTHQVVNGYLTATAITTIPIAAAAAFTLAVITIWMPIIAALTAMGWVVALGFIRAFFTGNHTITRRR